MLAAAALAFVASAETLLSAAAVDRMHSGPRTQYNRRVVLAGAPARMLSGLLGGPPMTGVIVRQRDQRRREALDAALDDAAWRMAAGAVAAAPQLLRLVPTASLAAILVYTGYKLVNPQKRSGCCTTAASRC